VQDSPLTPRLARRVFIFFLGGGGFGLESRFFQAALFLFGFNRLDEIVAVGPSSGTTTI